MRKAAERFNASANFDRRGNLRRSGAARLFRRLPGDALPTLHSFRRGGGQMRIRAPRDYRHNPRDAEFGALLDRPLHTVELEDGENESDLGQARSRRLLRPIRIRRGRRSTTAIRPRRTALPVAISKSCPTRARSTRTRWSACSPTKAARSPETSSAMKRRRVMEFSVLNSQL